MKRYVEGWNDRISGWQQWNGEMNEVRKMNQEKCADGGEGKVWRGG